MDLKKKLLIDKADKVLKARMKKVWAKHGTKSKGGEYSLTTIDAQKAYDKDRIAAQKEFNAALKKCGFKPIEGKNSRFAKK